MISQTNLRWSVLGTLSATSSALLIGLLMFQAFIPHQTVIDLGWHVAQGRWMVQHLWPYDQDKFNFPDLNHPVIDEYPVFQVILYLFSTLGLVGPPILASLGYGFLIYLSLRAPGLTKMLPRPVALYACLVALAGLMVGVQLRPHLITYLCITGFGLVLMANHRTKHLSALWPLFLLQAIWVNGHSGFVIGPAMIGLFGFEMICRASFRARLGGAAARAKLWEALRVWAWAFILDGLACLVNPYGFARLYLPFYQHDMVSLRAFDSEMLPLQQPFLGLFQELTFICCAAICFYAIRYRQICLSWILLAFVFYEEALSVQKYWPVFALFLPLIALSTSALKTPLSETTESGVIEKGAEGVLSAILIAGLIGAWMVVLNPSTSFSPLAAWNDFNVGHTKLPVESIHWMRDHQLEGRIFHRCEYGGLLQELGYTQGTVYGDTGFGKYSPEMIHELELTGDRVSYAKLALAWYHPDIVLCGNFSHLWPGFLRPAGWRLVHYTPAGSVWLRPGFRADLPEVSSGEVDAIFKKDLAEHGRGADLSAFARNVIALQALGLEDEAFAQARALHDKSFYWDMVAILNGMDPPLNPEHRLAFVQEAETLARKMPPSDEMPQSFLAQNDLLEGKPDAAFAIATNLKNPAGPVAEFLVNQAIKRGDWPTARSLLARTELYDLRSGRYYQLKAQSETEAGSMRQAGEDWNLAIYSWPDDPQIRALAKEFALRMNDTSLEQKLDDSLRFYGE